MKIYTRRGDAGQTDLFGGDRVGKDAIRVEAYGDVDELNAALGSAAASGSDPALEDSLRTIQSALFDLGASLATPDAGHRKKAGVEGVCAADVEALEALIDRLEVPLEELKAFILPGGSPSAAGFHVARTVCRRAERTLTALAETDETDPIWLRWINRLSDLLFVQARVVNHAAGVADVPWEPKS